MTTGVPYAGGIWRARGSDGVYPVLFRTRPYFVRYLSEVFSNLAALTLDAITPSVAFHITGVFETDVAELVTQVSRSGGYEHHAAASRWSRGRPLPLTHGPPRPRHKECVVRV